MSQPTGIDVSYSQGSYHWGAQKGRISFGMCKVTEGLTITDPDWVHNWNSMWDMNSTHTFPRFAYHLFHADDDPVQQADRFHSAVTAHGLLAGDNLVLDLESTKSDDTNADVAAAPVAERGRQFLERLDRLVSGTRVLVYTNPGFAETGACAGMQSWALWVADYGVSKPAVPKPWSGWTFWQKSETPIDQDVFNGTEAELLTWCRMPRSR